MAPASTSSPARTVAALSNRSLKQTEKIRRVSAWTRRASANCSKVVKAGLSLM